MHTKRSVLLIGSGRLAKHLQYWNSLLQEPNTLLCWDRNNSLQQLEQLIDQCSVVWLALSDSSIISFYEKHLQSKDKYVVHFSGALNDPRLLSAHPLMSFTPRLFDKDFYPKIHFVIEGCSQLTQALPGFQNSFTKMNSENKSLYHALCVLSGNFPQLLWNQVSQEMQSLNVPAPALDLYIEQIASNYLSLKEHSLTGPIVRKDFSTIEKNIESLNKSPSLQNIYSVFTKEFTK